MIQIKDFPNYAITICGRVWSYNRNRFLVGGLDKDGYKLWTACHKGNRKTLRFHQEVAKAYLPNPQKFSVINHKNGIKEDNRVCNLEWCSISHNTKHAYLLGGLNQSGENNNACKYSDTLVDVIKQNYTGGSIAEYARILEIPYSVVYSYIKGIRRS